MYNYIHIIILQNKTGSLSLKKDKKIPLQTSLINTFQKKKKIIKLYCSAHIL